MNIHKKVCLRFRAKHVLVLICWQTARKRKIFANTHGTKIFRKVAETDEKSKKIPAPSNESAGILGAASRNRTGTGLTPGDFKSPASTSSAMAACTYYNRTGTVCQTVPAAKKRFHAAPHELRKMPELFLCGAVLIFIKYGFIERAVLMCNDRGADRVAGNVDRSSRHIKNTVDTHDQADAGNRQADRIEYHRERDQADRRNACGADGCESRRRDNGQIIRRGQRNAERLRDEYDRNALHDGRAVHIDGRAERNGKGRNTAVNADLFLQRVDIHRDRRIGSSRREGEAHNRSKLLEEAQRIEARKQRKQNLVYAAALDEQREQNRAHILEHRDHRGEAETGERLCDQAEYTDRRQTHDHHGHLHHDVVALLEEVRDELGLILQLRKDDADDQRKNDDLEHFAVRERTDRVLRDYIEDGLREADRLAALDAGLDLLHLRHIQTDARPDEQANAESDRDCHHGRQDIEADDLDADLAEGLAVTDRGRAADQRAENQRYDKHLHQTDEALTDDIENTVYQYILHKFHVRRGDMQHNTQNGAHNQRNKDLRCQTDLLFLFRSAHLCAPPFFVLK